MPRRQAEKGSRERSLSRAGLPETEDWRSGHAVGHSRIRKVGPHRRRPIHSRPQREPGKCPAEAHANECPAATQKKAHGTVVSQEPVCRRQRTGDLDMQWAIVEFAKSDLTDAGQFIAGRNVSRANAQPRPTLMNAPPPRRKRLTGP